MIDLDPRAPVSVRNTGTERLKRIFLQVEAAINQFDAGYPMEVGFGEIRCRLTDVGREKIAQSVYSDLIIHRSEIREELQRRGVMP